MSSKRLKQWFPFQNVKKIEFAKEHISIKKKSNHISSKKLSKQWIVQQTQSPINRTNNWQFLLKSQRNPIRVSGWPDWGFPSDVVQKREFKQKTRVAASGEIIKIGFGERIRGEIRWNSREQPVLNRNSSVREGAI
jgi:hypothetical protein